MKRTILFLLAAALLLAACSQTPEPSECATCNSVVIPPPPGDAEKPKPFTPTNDRNRSKAISRESE